MDYLWCSIASGTGILPVIPNRQAVSLSQQEDLGFLVPKLRLGIQISRVLPANWLYFIIIGEAEPRRQAFPGRAREREERLLRCARNDRQDACPTGKVDGCDGGTGILPVICLGRSTNWVSERQKFHDCELLFRHWTLFESGFRHVGICLCSLWETISLYFEQDLALCQGKKIRISESNFAGQMPFSCHCEECVGCGESRGTGDEPHRSRKISPRSPSMTEPRPMRFPRVGEAHRILRKLRPV